MPEPMDRETFLAHVAGSLRMPTEAARDALEELRGHIDEGAAALRGDGVEGREAERRAVGRMGDPRTLGRDLTSAHRASRPLLAYVGGIVRAAVATAVWSYVFAFVAALVAAAIAFPVAVAICTALGRTWGSFLTGPAASAWASALGALAIGAAAWVLPARLAEVTGRALDRTRRGTAVAGLLVGSVFAWFLLDTALDRVTAVTLPLAPVLFAAVALRAPAEPTFRPGLLPGLALGVVLILPTALVAAIAATPSQQGQQWSAELSGFGLAPEDAGLADTSFAVDTSGPVGGRAGEAFRIVDVSFANPAGETVLVSIRGESVQASVRDGAMVFGTTLGIAEAFVDTPMDASDNVVSIEVPVPTPRDPLTTALIVTGLRPDGTRVVLDADLSLDETPPWHGSPWEWWFGD